MNSACVCRCLSFDCPCVSTSSGCARKSRRCPRKPGRRIPITSPATPRCGSSVSRAARTTTWMASCGRRRTSPNYRTCARYSRASARCGVARACCASIPVRWCPSTPTSTITGSIACACTSPSSRAPKCCFTAAAKPCTCAAVKPGCSTTGVCTASRTRHRTRASISSRILPAARASGSSWRRPRSRAWPTASFASTRRVTACCSPSRARCGP